MARGFQLTAELVLTGPKGIQRVSKNLSRLKVMPAGVDKQFSNLSDNISQTTNAATNFGKTVDAVNKGLGDTRKGVDQTSKSMQNVGKSTVKSVGALENFGRTIGFVTTRLIGFKIATGFVTGFGGSVIDAGKDAISFRRELVRVAQVTGKSMDQLSSLEKEITRLSVAFGVASDELVDVSRILSQAGLSANQTRIALEALAKSTLLPTFDDMNQTAEGSIAIFNQFELEAKDLLGVLSAIDAVTGKLAVEASDVVIAVKKAGGIFSALNKEVDNGVESFNEFLAVFASVRQTTRESAQTIAVGLRTFFTRIQRPRTIEFLRQYGIELENLNQPGQLLKPLEIINKLSDAVGELGARNLNIGKLVQQLGGVRQVAKVLPLLFQQELRQKALKIATQGQVDAEEKLNKALATLSVRISQVREEFKAFIRDVVDSSTFQILSRSILDIAQNLTKLAGAIKPILPSLAILGGAKAIKPLGMIGKGVLGGAMENPLAARAGVAGATGGGVGTSAAIVAGLAGRPRRGYGAASAASLGRPQGQWGQPRQSRLDRVRRGLGTAGRFAGRHTGGVAIGGALLGGVAAEQIGTETRGRAGIGGALVGAGTGAAIGSLGGPWGAAIGALIGGVTSVTSALKEFDKALREKELEKSSKRVGKVFESFEDQKIEVDKLNTLLDKEAKKRHNLLQEKFQISEEQYRGRGLFGGAGRGAGRAYTPPSTKYSAFSEEELLGLVKPNKEAVKGYIDEYTALLDQQLKEGVDPSNLSKEFKFTLGLLYGDPERAAEAYKDSKGNAELLYRQMEQMGESFAKSRGKVVQTREELEELNIKLDTTEHNLRKLGARLKAAIDIAGQASLGRAETALSRAQGKATLGGVQTRNIFSNIQGFSRETISKELERLNVGGELGGQVELARALPDLLKGVVDQVKDFTSFEISTEFKKRLANILPSGSKILSLMEQKIDKMEEKSPEEIFEKLSKDLPERSQLAVDAVNQFQEGLNKARIDFRKATNQELKLRLDYINNLADTNASEVELRNNAITARGGQLSLQQQLAPTSRKLQTLGAGTSLNEILQSREEAETPLEVQKAISAIEILAGATKELTIVQQKIAEIEERSIAAQKTVQDAFLQGSKETVEQTRNLQAFIKFQKTGILTKQGLRGGQFVGQLLQQQGREEEAAQLGTRLTRAIPGSQQFAGGIGVAEPGKAAPRGLRQYESSLRNQVIEARRVSGEERLEQINKFSEESRRAFEQRVTALREALTLYDNTTTQLTEALTNSNIALTINAPDPIPLTVHGGGELSNEITDAVSQRLESMIREEVVKHLPDTTNLT